MNESAQKMNENCCFSCARNFSIGVRSVHTFHREKKQKAIQLIFAFVSSRFADFIQPLHHVVRPSHATYRFFLPLLKKRILPG